MYYEIAPAVRANPERRLDQPWNVIKKTSPGAVFCQIIARGYDRDDAEEILEKRARRNGWVKTQDGYTDERHKRRAPQAVIDRLREVSDIVDMRSESCGVAPEHKEAMRLYLDTWAKAPLDEILRWAEGEIEATKV